MSNHLVHVTPSARKELIAARPSWGWRPGMLVLISRWGVGFQFSIPRPEDGSLVEFRSRGLRLAVRADEETLFRDSILSCNFDSLFTRPMWWMNRPHFLEPSPCSDPVGASCCPVKFRKLHPELFGLRQWLNRLRGGVSREDRDQLVAHVSDQMRIGDGRAAVVLRTSPLLAAAYCDEHDAVVLLRFPSFLVEQHSLKEGDRLVTCNLHRPVAEGPPASDIRPGPRASGKFNNVCPMIADFLALEEELVERRRRAISPAEYDRCRHLGEQAVRADQSIRSGRPLLAGKPG